MPRLKIEYSEHARKRLYEREATEEIVRAVLAEPDYLRESFGGRMMAVKRIGGRTWTVVFKDNITYIYVVTLYYR